MNTTFKKGKDLEVGDVFIRPYSGIIIEVDAKGKSNFMNNEPNFTYYDINGSYFGPGTHFLNIDDDFEIITDRKEIIRQFKTIDCDLSKYIADTMQQRQDLNAIRNSIFHKLSEEIKKSKAT